jgi:enoyl-[acyl-carrier-protein] reductase (NADH)
MSLSRRRMLAVGATGLAATIAVPHDSSQAQQSTAPIAAANPKDTFASKVVLITGANMLKVGGGAIINMTSIGGQRAFPNIIGYGASKAAVIHMTKSAAQEYGKTIRINAVAPGPINTAMLDRVK